MKGHRNVVVKARWVGDGSLVQAAVSTGEQRRADNVPEVTSHTVVTFKSANPHLHQRGVHLVIKVSPSRIS